MKNFLALLFLILLFACSRNYPDIEPGSTQILKKSDDRIALLSVPSDYSPRKAHPLFIALHGHGDIAPAFHDLWKPVCDSLGVVLLTPQGTEHADIGFGWTLSGNSERFLRDIIVEAQKRVHIDPDKISIGGFSAGGTLAYYMGLRYPHVFSGAVALGASCNEEWIHTAKPNNPLKHQRMYIGHGELEPNIKEVLITKDLLVKVGVTVELSVYRNTGHGIPEPKRDELFRALKFITEK